MLTRLIVIMLQDLHITSHCVVHLILTHATGQLYLSKTGKKKTRKRQLKKKSLVYASCVQLLIQKYRTSWTRKKSK